MIATNITAVQLTTPGVIRSHVLGRKLSPAPPKVIFTSVLFSLSHAVAR